MFWPWSSALAKRKRDDAEAVSGERDAGWPELVSRVLRRAADGGTAAAGEAAAAVRALDPRLRFLQRLAAEEAMLPRAGAERQGGEAGDRIAEVYGLLSKTFVLPSVRPAAGAPVERGGQSSSGASGAGAAAAGAAAGVYGYDEAKERAKREAFLGTLPRAIKEEIAQIKDWDAFDVFNVRARAPRPPAGARRGPGAVGRLTAPPARPIDRARPRSWTRCRTTARCTT